MPCVNTPLRKEEEVIKVHYKSCETSILRRMRRKPKKNELELIKLLDEEKCLRNEQQELCIN